MQSARLAVVWAMRNERGVGIRVRDSGNGATHASSFWHGPGCKKGRRSASPLPANLMDRATGTRYCRSPIPESRIPNP